MKRIGQSLGSFLGGAFLLAWANYHFTRPHCDLWMSKIAGETAALGAVLIAVSVWLISRRTKSK
jgi:hypothetical protein